ncbi:flavonol synthase 1-like [Nymphaea colorata]|nr:flavonol synthase 1-like [Nymphaea colorata]
MGADRVQNLASMGVDRLPEQFVREAHERPENSKAIEGKDVPVISLNHPFQKVGEEIARACQEWGIFILTDHNIPPESIKALQDVGRQFFELPVEEKEKYANDAANGNLEGYGTKMVKNQAMKLEWIDYYFHMLSPPSNVDYTKWPRDPPSYREVTEEYGKELTRVSDLILVALSNGLGLEEGAMKEAVGGDKLVMEMKINLYPRCPQPELALGVEAHTDMSAITILVADRRSGLQVWKDGNWVAVDLLPGSLVIHVGDQIEVLSNGKYKSVLHRSLVSKDDVRMSWAVFCVPPLETIIGPLPQLINENNPPLFTTKSYKEFQYRKINKLPQ